MLMYKAKIRSRHPSHLPLRTKLEKLPVKSVIRLGSTTELPDTVSKGGKRIEINTVEGVKNSSNKLLMKQCFDKLNVKTAKWQTISDFIKEPKIEYPIVVKHIYGSRGRGNYLFRENGDLSKFNTSNYIVEEYRPFVREYRLHVTNNGCFYTCRKMLKSDTPEKDRWFRNNANSVWILEDNDMFDKPINWNQIVEECVKGLNSIGLDFCAVDLRVQSSVDKKGNKRENPDFFLVEVNSAPSFGSITEERYLKMLPELIMQKSKQLNIK